MPSPVSVEVVIGLYLVLAFFFSALLVRFFGQSSLSKSIRRHFYIFPAIPLIAIVVLLLKMLWYLILYPTRLLRFLFEKLSGKKTFRKRKYHAFFFGS
ncbi:hypothetical protein [Sphingorhabdus sp. 109]|jgi:Na+/proline symporter|uniref:hypothetical protein n=1 Tax=Sphingorhabdus sp. 109 TaxID=2653173 RepID=UPI0012F22C9A|nr:hypothetical protein [Sphingorhabdus sp. 109]VWX62023.1 conserved hypothetical protein [Sphingorhabdus sp. 109]